MVPYFSIFQSPGLELIRIGPIVLRWYGILIAVAVLIGLNLSSKLAGIRGLKNRLVNDLMPILVLASVIGARAYYVIFEWRNYSGIYFWSSINLLGFNIPIPRALEIWGGGIAIHGALIGGTISVIIFCRWRKESFWDVLDIILPSVVLGQAIGRWGNFFNNEAFGLPTDLPWKLFIPNLYRPDVFINENFFHPTFLYESIWNLVIFILLISLFRIGQKKPTMIPPGSISCIYLISYSIGRFWIEALRIDPLCLAGLPPYCEGGIRMAQLVSAFLILIATSRLYWIFRQRKQSDVTSKIVNR